MFVIFTGGVFFFNCRIKKEIKSVVSFTAQCQKVKWRLNLTFGLNIAGKINAKTEITLLIFFIFQCQLLFIPMFFPRKKHRICFLYMYICKISVKILQVRSSTGRKYKCIKGHNSETLKIVLIIWFRCWFFFHTKITSLDVTVIAEGFLNCFAWILIHC